METNWREMMKGQIASLEKQLVEAIHYQEESRVQQLEAQIADLVERMDEDA